MYALAVAVAVAGEADGNTTNTWITGAAIECHLQKTRTTQ
jgi:hypothetical protein